MGGGGERGGFVKGAGVHLVRGRTGGGARLESESETFYMAPGHTTKT